jgi:hypothetical protein
VGKSEKLLLILALAILCVGAARADVLPFSIAINAPANRIKSGDDLPMTVVLRNMSSQKSIIHTSLGKTNAEIEYDIRVKHADGTAVPKTPYEQNLEAKGTRGSAGLCILNPGDTCEERTNVANLYDLTKPGTYVIQVGRTPGDGSAVVTSNTITVQVTP